MSRPLARALSAVGLAVGLAALAAPTHAQSLAGTWTITSEGRGGALTRTLVLSQDGAALSGSITFAFGGRRGGGAGGAPQAFPISDGSVEGNAFRFTMSVDVQGTSITQRYSGTFDGDTMQGQVEGGRGGSQPFTGRRGG